MPLGNESVTDKFADIYDHAGSLSLRRILRIIDGVQRDEIDAHFAGDPWARNLVLNLWEYHNKVSEVESYPWNIAFPIADLCNARCTFCTSWVEGKAFFTLDDARHYEELLPYARTFGYQGHGEPLANPKIIELIRYFGERLDPRCVTYTITNGVYLEKCMDVFQETGLNNAAVSLNATTSEIHDKVMGLGPTAFEKIIKTLKTLSKEGQTDFSISMVLTADNFHQAADFVKLGNDLGATTVYLRTLAPASVPPKYLNYHLLSPIFLPDFAKHKDRALQAIEASRVPVEAAPETWDKDNLPEKIRKEVTENPPAFVERRDVLRNKEYRKRPVLSGDGRFQSYVDDLNENIYGREAPFSCGFIYHNMISTRTDYEVIPCCYMRTVPGHERVVLGKERPFHQYWNSDAFVALRTRLREGPLFQACARCPNQGCI